MARGKPATRVAGGVGLLAAIVSAAALTGAAFFTVNQASCGDQATYLRHDGQIHLVGGCVDPAELPAAPAEKPERNSGAESGFYQP